MLAEAIGHCVHFFGREVLDNHVEHGQKCSVTVDGEIADRTITDLQSITYAPSDFDKSSHKTFIHTSGVRKYGID